MVLYRSQEGHRKRLQNLAEGDIPVMALPDICQKKARHCLETAGLIPIPTWLELQPPTHPGLLTILLSACSPRSIRSTLANHSLTNPKAINLLVLPVNDICSRDTKPHIICFFLQWLFSWHAPFYLLARSGGLGTRHRQQPSNSLTFTVANGKNHASFRCTNQLSDARQTAAFPIEDNMLLREDFFHQVGTRLLSDFLHFLVQKELSDCLKSESVI